MKKKKIKPSGKKKEFKSDPFLKFLFLSFLFMVVINFLMVLDSFEAVKEVSSKGLLYFSQPILEKDFLTTSVMVDPKEKGINVVDMVIHYDPQVLTFIGLDEGEFFENPMVLQKKIDFASGKMKVGYFTWGSAQEEGSLVNLTFKIKDKSPGPVEVLIDDEESVLGVYGEKKNFLGEARDFIYRILPN